jgi:ornithine decarboxylase
VVSPRQLKQLADQHGTPLFVVDHSEIRRNFAMFRKYLPRVQAYYAVKANPDPAIVNTLFRAGASFDVASMPEFNIVHENIKTWPAKKRQDFIWDKIVYANPVKDNRTLAELDPYKPLVTYDNLAEVGKIKKYAPHAGLVLRVNVPNTGSMVELSSKFGASPGEAVDLMEAAFRRPGGRGAVLPRGQPVHELPELRAGPRHRRRHLQGGLGARPQAGQDPRHRRRLPRALRPARAAHSRSWPRP